MFALFYTFLYTMMSRKEYMDWQNRQDRVSEYICVPASGAIFGVFNSFTVKKVNFFTINVKCQNLIFKKWGGGGIFVQAIPPPKKVGGGGVSPHPPGIYASGLRSN